MMTIKDGKGREVITMSDPPPVRAGGGRNEVITTGNVDEILRRRAAEAEKSKLEKPAEKQK